MDGLLERPADAPAMVVDTTEAGHASPFPSEHVLCVHFGSNGRSHAMSFVDAGLPPDSAPSDLWAHWRVTPDGVRGGVLLSRRLPLLDAALLTAHETARPLRLCDRLGHGQAALLQALRHRPLLVTLSRAGDMEPATVGVAHQLLVRAVVDHAGRGNNGLPRDL